MTEKLEGTLALVVDGPLENINIFHSNTNRDQKLLFYSSGLTDKFCPVDFDLMRMIARNQGWINAHEIFGGLERFADFGGVSDFVNSKIGIEREIMNIILDGRVKFVVLLRTAGGDVTTMMRIVDFQDFVRRKSGQVMTMGSQQIFSAGAEIFIRGDGDRRFISDGSTMMFHLDSVTTDAAAASDDSEAYGRRCEAIRKFRDDMLSRTRVEERSRILEMLEKAEKIPDMCMYVKSQMAERLGWARVMPLRRMFNSGSLLTSGIYEGTALEEYFLEDSISG